MSTLRKLCDVYDAVIDTTGAEEDRPLPPIGFVQKRIKYNILLSPGGEFLTAQPLPEEEQLCAVPSSPQAEGRASKKSAPFPLADCLKYLIANDKRPLLFGNYIAQLEDWCAAPDAPDCLRVLLGYLKKKTLYADLCAVPGLKCKFYKDENDTTGEGPDAKSFACFSIAYWGGEEQRLWMRADVWESWSRRLAALTGEETGLCYITGARTPIMEIHPYLVGSTRLISGKDSGFPFQYKGRFINDRSAATVGAISSAKAHNALKWLLDHQGFKKYGTLFVGWNTKAPQAAPDEADEKAYPDTFEAYVNALFKSLQGYNATLKKYANAGLTEEAKRRIEEIVILGLEAATKGRMSVIYSQTLPGNVFAARVNQWNEICRWGSPEKNGCVFNRPVTWKEICEAVMGVDAVRKACVDPQQKARSKVESDADAVQKKKEKIKPDMNAIKLMRDLQMRLLHCVIEGEALPLSLVKAAYNRAVQPLSFTDQKGQWIEPQWRNCVAAACAMIRMHSHYNKSAFVPSPALDAACTDRGYLYGRLLAVAHWAERPATEEGKTNAVRMMRRFALRPEDAWPTLYCKLLPALKALGRDGHSARFYKRLLGQIEGLFPAEDAQTGDTLFPLFLVGFSAQIRALAQGQSGLAQTPSRDYAPPQGRDELFGCLLAVADHFEWASEMRAEEGKPTLSDRDGRTNAMTLTAAFIARPMTAWPKIHDRLLPYLEKSGEETARYAQRLLSRIEQAFQPEDRLSDAPLGRGFLRGYLMMLQALSASGLNREAWRPAAPPQEPPIESREAAFGALLALENQAERRILDLSVPEEENRPSNAMRFMARSAQRPSDVWAYLENRMRPYAQKSWFSKRLLRRAEALHARVVENQWNSDAPLGPEYLYFFYLCNLNAF